MPKKYLLAFAGALAVGVAVLLVVPGRGPPSPPEPMAPPILAARESAPATSEAAHPAETPAAEMPMQPPDVIAKANEVLARGDSTPEEVYHANYQLLMAHHAAGNATGERRAMQGMIDSGVLSAAEQAALVRAMTALKSQGVED